MEIVRKYLAASEIGSTSVRYDPDTDTLQVSPDGGITWNDAPEIDPRTLAAGLLPARSTGDPRCDSAESAMQHYKAVIDAFLASADAFAFAGTFLGLLLFIPGVDVLWSLLVAIGLALLEVGKVAVEANMTSDFYDDLRCIFLNNMDASGQLSDAALAQVYADVAAQESSAANDIFVLVTSAWGRVGFNNAGASGEYTGDCTSCIPVGYEWDWTSSAGGWSIVSGRGSGRDANGWDSLYNFAGLHVSEIRIVSPSFANRTLTRFVVTYSSTAPLSGGSTFYTEGTSISHALSTASGDPVIDDQSITFATGAGTWRIDMAVSGSNQTIHIKKLRVYTSDISGLTGGVPVYP